MKKLLYFLFLIPFLSSCDKEKTVELLPIDVLTGGDAKFWKFETYMMDGQNFIADPCYLDDSIIFYKQSQNHDTDGYQNKYEWNFGTDFCGLPPTEPLSVSFNFSPDGKFFYLEDLEFHVLELTPNKFVIETTENAPIHQYLVYLPLETSNKSQN